MRSTETEEYDCITTCAKYALWPSPLLPPHHTPNLFKQYLFIWCRLHHAIFTIRSNDMAGNMQSFLVVYTIESIRFQLKWGKNRFQLYSLQRSSAFISLSLCCPSLSFHLFIFINSEWRKCTANKYFERSFRSVLSRRATHGIFM